jgi:hypothetical protein
MARTLMTIEEHGAGKQFVRFRVWPYSTVQGWMLLLLFAALSTGAAMDHAWTSAAILGVVAVFLAVRTLLECAGAMAVLLGALKRLEADTP